MYFFQRARTFRRIFSGKIVLLVGSGPVEELPSRDSYDLIVSANSSAGALAAHPFGPDITFITSALLSNKIDDSTWKLAASMMAKVPKPQHLISIRNGAHFEKKANLIRFGFKPKDLTIIGLGRMRRILTKTSKSKLAGKAPDGLPSIGVIALSLCFYFGADKVLLTGFNLTIPKISNRGTYHYYEEENEPSKNQLRTMRSHSSADSLIISSLAIQGHAIGSNSLEINALLNNWGLNGQQFYRRNILTKIFWSKFVPW